MSLALDRLGLTGRSGRGRRGSFEVLQVSRDESGHARNVGMVYVQPVDRAHFKLVFRCLHSNRWMHVLTRYGIHLYARSGLQAHYLTFQEKQALPRKHIQVSSGIAVRRYLGNTHARNWIRNCKQEPSSEERENVICIYQRPVG